MLNDQVEVESFLGQAPDWNPNDGLLTGAICGHRVEAIRKIWARH